MHHRLWAALTAPRIVPGECMFGSLNRAALGASASLLAVVAMCGGVGLWSSSALSQALRDSQRTSELLRSHLSADMMHDAIRGDVLSALLSRDPAAGMSIEDAKRDLQEHMAEFNQHVARELELAATPQERETLQALAEPLNAYAASAQSIMEIAERDPEAAAAALSGFFEQFGVLESSMEAATDAIGASASAAAEAADATASQASVLMLASLLLALAATIGLVWVARKYLVRPLLDLTSTMNALAAGDNNIQAPNTERRDEIGAMARAVVAFRQGALDRIKLEADAEVQRKTMEEQRLQAERDRISSEAAARAAEERARLEREAERARSEAERRELDEQRRREMEQERQRAEAAQRAAEEQRRAEMDAERARNEEVLRAASQAQAKVVAALAQGLARLAEGDLTAAVSDPVPQEYEKLRSDFNIAVTKLHDAMAEVTHEVSAIHSGSADISRASDDLSRRTETQAASLEETAAALDQITATVAKTASGAKEATSMVGAARGVAQESGDIVKQAIEAMEAIEKSSVQIAQIIGVIDEIAFQTNLLALNAGVEAARAGDAGRGFAVVASEVRALAQRSAEAAKEIKALITTSSNQVESGAELVNRTGQSLLSIIERVTKIDAVVRDIAASASEQSTALAEVNGAINQMDQTTQQNAAMVEETTAAGHALVSEANALAALVQRFRLDAARLDQEKPVVRRVA